MTDTEHRPKRGFWLTPFSPESAGGEDRELFEAVRAAIREAAEVIGLDLERADDIFLSGVVIDQVVDRIRQADVVIATCTGRNPNVFYELGIADNVGHKTILIAATSDDLPFDVQHYRAQLYGNKRDLATLASRVGKAIEQTLSEGPSEGTLGQPTPRLAIPLTKAVSLIEGRRSALADLVPEKWSVSAQTWVAQTETLLLRLFGDGHLLVERVSVVDFSPYMRPVGLESLRQVGAISLRQRARKPRLCWISPSTSFGCRTVIDRTLQRRLSEQIRSEALLVSWARMTQ